MIYNINITLKMDCRRRFILAGSPGIGKTTIVKAVCNSLKTLNIPLIGFYTEELRENKERIGFDIINLNGQHSPLARISKMPESYSCYKVGKYNVLVDTFEPFLLSIFNQIPKSINNIVVIDEIGKMELFSDKFAKQIETLFSNVNLILLATIPIAKGKAIPLVEKIRNDPKNKIFNVNITNRDQMHDIILNEITNLL